MNIEVKRGDIVLVDLEPIVGSEQGKVRPVSVIQNDVGNDLSPVTIVASITSKVFDKEYPINVFIPSKISGLDKDSTILLNQIRTIDKQRIVKKLGKIDQYYFKKIDSAIVMSLGVDCLNVL